MSFPTQMFAVVCINTLIRCSVISGTSPLIFRKFSVQYMRLGIVIVKFLTIFPIEVLLDDNFKVLPINCDPVVKQLSCDSTRIIKFRIYGSKESV